LEEMDDIVLRPEISDEEDEPAKVAQGKRKRGDDRKERKKKRREMPTFGSYEEYAKLIEEAGNEGED
jgi:ribosome biogenesis protein MAK21